MPLLLQARLGPLRLGSSLAFAACDFATGAAAARRAQGEKNHGQPGHHAGGGEKELESALFMDTKGLVLGPGPPQSSIAA